MTSVKGGNSSGPADVAVDTVSSESVQRVKLVYGADGTGTRVDTATPLPVDDDATQSKLDTVITLLGTSVATQIAKDFSATSTATGHAVWIPASGKKIAITHFSLSTAGNVAGKVTMWFGAAADTTYTSGTDQVAFKGSFAPSSIASTYPGVVVQPASPILAGNADYSLRVTTDNSMTWDLVLYGYEF